MIMTVCENRNPVYKQLEKRVFNLNKMLKFVFVLAPMHGLWTDESEACKSQTLTKVCSAYFASITSISIWS